MVVSNSKKKLPLVLLLIANTFPLFGILYFGWTVEHVLFAYVTESLAVGLIAPLKIGKAAQKPTSPITINGRKSYAGRHYVFFFLFHYGIFLFAQFMWVTSFSTEQVVGTGEIIGMFTAFLISHGISYRTNYLGKGEYKSTSPDKQMFLPYKRIGILLIAIFVGGWLIELVGLPGILVVVLVLVKIVFDVIAHITEHRSYLKKG